MISPAAKMLGRIACGHAPNKTDFHLRVLLADTLCPLDFFVEIDDRGLDQHDLGMLIQVVVGISNFMSLLAQDGLNVCGQQFGKVHRAALDILEQKCGQAASEIIDRPVPAIRVFAGSQGSFFRSL